MRRTLSIALAGALGTLAALKLVALYELSGIEKAAAAMELALAVLLVFKRTRSVGLWCTLAFVLATIAGGELIHGSKRPAGILKRRAAVTPPSLRPPSWPRFASGSIAERREEASRGFVACGCG